MFSLFAVASFHWQRNFGWISSTAVSNQKVFSNNFQLQKMQTVIFLPRAVGELQAVVPPNSDCDLEFKRNRKSLQTLFSAIRGKEEDTQEKVKNCRRCHLTGYFLLRQVTFCLLSSFFFIPTHIQINYLLIMEPYVKQSASVVSG